MKKLSFLIFYCIICNVYLLAKTPATNNKSKLQIAVSIKPLAFFVENIAKDKTDVKIIVPNNKNSETFEPDFKIIKMLENTDMLVFIGMPFEKIYIEKMLRIKKDSTNILRLDSILANNDTHEEISHLWLSLNNAKIIAKEITQNLVALDSKNANFYNQNLEILLHNIESSQAKIKEILKPMEKRDFIVYHPLFEGFEDEYGLIEHSLEKHGKKYGLQDILALSNFAKKIGIKRIFTQSENKDIKTLATSINAKLIMIDPLSKDYLKNLESIMSEIAKSYD